MTIQRHFFSAAILVGLFCLCPLTFFAEERVSDLWILSGQSNACGRAKLPGPDPNLLVSMFNPANDTFVVAQDPLPHMGTTGTGPWVAAAMTVANHSQQPVRMCGFARGGKPIEFWYPGAPGHKGLFAVIETAGQKADVFLWYQGESNATLTDTSDQYRQKLVEHVARVRIAAGNLNMLAVIVQLGPALREDIGDFTVIREAQRQFVMNDSNAILVPALGRTLKDTVHLDNDGYRELGREIGRGVLRARHNNPVGDWPGPVLDAAGMAQNNRNTLIVHFAEVRQLHNVAAEDFVIVHAEGTNRCISIATGKTLATLSFEKNISLPARIIYGFGQNPKASLVDESGNRAPAVQLVIDTGTVPIDKQTSMANGAGHSAR